MGLSITQVLNAIAAAYPDREALVFRDKRFSYQQMMKRANRLTNFLLEQDITLQRPREELENWESGQDHVAIYMQNGNEYLEASIATMQARAVGFNVNFRYVAEELQYLLANADTRAVIYHAKYAAVLAELLPNLASVKLLIQVDDDSGNALLPGALDYETVLSGSSDAPSPLQTSGEDLYMLYTGGTTGMPKGVLWRQQDLLVVSLLGAEKDGEPISELSRFVQRAAKGEGRKTLPAPPFMHGTGHWVAIAAWVVGRTVVIQDKVDRLDAHDILSVLAQEQVNMLTIVGDAFARPLLDALDNRQYDLSSLKSIHNAGAILSPKTKTALLEKIPGISIADQLGSSETGIQASQVSDAASDSTRPRLTLSNRTTVLSEDLSSVLAPGHEGLGWLANTGLAPLGYLGDREKTEKTFPTLNGVRYAVAGDRVRLLENGEIDFRGRDSVTINSGGEKIFAEEVEQALNYHADVQDVVVSSRPSERWGNEVVGLVQLRPGARFDHDSLIAEAAKHIARYKLPKALVEVERVQRGANGKVNYRWAKELAADTLG